LADDLDVVGVRKNRLIVHDGSSNLSAQLAVGDIRFLLVRRYRAGLPIALIYLRVIRLGVARLSVAGNGCNARQYGYSYFLVFHRLNNPLAYGSKRCVRSIYL
jgi:hypothetical protein